MIYFIDTSAWIKFFIKEDGTREIQDFILKESQSESNIFAASAVIHAEMHATFKRSLNGNRLTEKQYNDAVTVFSDQWENVDIPEVNNLLIEESGKTKSYSERKNLDKEL
jgi:predicted nucleic acid-binding protein